MRTLIIVIISFTLLAACRQQPSAEKPTRTSAVSQPAQAATYTCPMHPQVKQPKPGKCPICGMELVPMDEKGKDNQWVHIEEAAQQAAHIVTARATKIIPHKAIILTGRVSKDAQRTFLQTAHIGGRIEKLHIRSEGQFIRKGQPIITLYSPELIAAQRELLEVASHQATFSTLYQATVRKLKNWKLTDQQIQEILHSKTVKENVPILSDYSGYITAIHVQEGKHVPEGGALLSVLATDRVWIDLDVPQSERAWLHTGMPITVLTEANSLPAKLESIIPIVDARSRTLTAKAMLVRPAVSLVPGMFIRARAHYTFPDSMIVVPQSAVLWTGRESWVYVQEQSGAFSPRKVQILTEAEEGFVIQKGLAAGEIFVKEGAYRVDAAAQLAGKPSMLNPHGQKAANAAHGHHH